MSDFKNSSETLAAHYEQQIADLTEQATKAASRLQLRLDAIIDANAQLIKTNAQLVEINAALTDQLLDMSAEPDDDITLPTLLEG
jgi:hypothetical protein